MSKIKKVLIIIFIIVAILGTISLTVTYLVGSGKTNSESLEENNHYDGLKELQELEKETDPKLKKTENKNDKVSFNLIKNNIKAFIFSTNYADNSGLGEPIQFDEKINRILEKYYILSKLDLSKIPKPIFNYARTNWNELPMILNSYDYLNKTTTLYDYIKLKKEYRKKIFYENTIKPELIKIINDYFENKKRDYKVSYFPKDIESDKGYQFMIDGLKNHKYLVSTSKNIGKKLDFDYRLTLAAILTEQFRYNGTYRGVVKSYIKQTPFLFSMTQWSYGIGGIKEFTGKKIIEDSKIYNTYNKVFYGLKTKTYKYKTTKQLLQDPYWESVFPNVLISNIINRWDATNNSIKDKPGIILTLYNFGNNSNKKPHNNPKIGGALIKLNEKENRKYSFGGLGEALYYYIKVYGLYK